MADAASDRREELKRRLAEAKAKKKQAEDAGGSGARGVSALDDNNSDDGAKDVAEASPRRQRSGVIGESRTSDESRQRLSSSSSPRASSSASPRMSPRTSHLAVQPEPAASPRVSRISPRGSTSTTSRRTSNTTDTEGSSGLVPQVSSPRTPPATTKPAGRGGPVDREALKAQLLERRANAAEKRLGVSGTVPKHTSDRTSSTDARTADEVMGESTKDALKRRMDSARRRRDGTQSAIEDPVDKVTPQPAAPRAVSVVLNKHDTSMIRSYDVDDQVEAIFTEDQMWYKAVVTDVREDGTYVVLFTEYGNDQVTRSPLIRRPVKAQPPRDVTSTRSPATGSIGRKSGAKVLSRGSSSRTPAAARTRPSQVTSSRAQTSATLTDADVDSMPKHLTTTAPADDADDDIGLKMSDDLFVAPRVSQQPSPPSVPKASAKPATAAPARTAKKDVDDDDDDNGNDSSSEDVLDKFLNLVSSKPKSAKTSSEPAKQPAAEPAKKPAAEPAKKPAAEPAPKAEVPRAESPRGRTLTRKQTIAVKKAQAAGKPINEGFFASLFSGDGGDSEDDDDTDDDYETTDTSTTMDTDPGFLDSLFGGVNKKK